MRRVACCLLALAAGLSVVGCLSIVTPSAKSAPSAEPAEKVPIPTPAAPLGEYTESSGQWSVAYRTDTWQPDPDDDTILHHASEDCGLVLAGWPMGMEGPEAELFEMRERQIPLELGGHTFLRSILAARSDQAPYAGEIAYYLSQGDLWAHIVLVLGKEVYGKPEAVALCQQDAEAVVSSLSVK